MSGDLILPSGIGILNRVMNGGLYSGYVTHVYGQAASGKTTLALQFTAEAFRQGFGTFYVNTEASSPINRLEQIANGTYEDMEDSVKIITPRNFGEQGVLVDDLDLYVREGTKIIVIDTLTRHYRLAMDESKKTNFANHRELNRQVGTLKGLARKRDVAVLLLNQVTSRPQGTEEFEPVAENILSFWSDVTIKMDTGEAEGARIIRRLTPEGEPSIGRLYFCDGGFSPEPQTDKKQ